MTTHGSPSTYTNQGCRCAECTESIRVAMVRRREVTRWNELARRVLPTLSNDQLATVLITMTEFDDAQPPISKFDARLALAMHELGYLTEGD